MTTHSSASERSDASRMQEALEEASERLGHAPDCDEVMQIWSADLGNSPSNLVQFLNNNNHRLSPEAKFFLSVVIEMRKLSQQVIE